VTGRIRVLIVLVCDPTLTKCSSADANVLTEFNLTCEYIRERKKRGKASRKDLAQQAAAAAAAAAAANNGQKSPTEHSSDGRSPSESRLDNGSSAGSSTHSDSRGPESRSLSLNDAVGLQKPLNGVGQRLSKASRAKSLGTLAELPHQHQHQPLLTGQQDNVITQDQVVSPTDIGLNGYGPMHGYRPAMNSHMLNNGQSISYGTPSSLPGYGDLPYSMQSPPNYPVTSQSPGAFRLGDNDLPGFPMDSPGHTPGWSSMQSPVTQYHMTSHHNYNSPCRYPVLHPLIPHLGNIIPVSLACDLIDLYFASSSSAQMHPMSPYVLGYVFRKRSFLHPTKPRICSPALLASMLWVAAQTSDAAFLTAPPAARGRVCQRLLELTVGLLKPLIHGPPTGDTANFADTVINGVALGGLGVSMPATAGANASGESGAFGAAGALDDVVTYIHLATVVSASEYKGASLRWWNAAWALARELKLGRELSPNQPSNDIDADADADDDLEMPNTTTTTGNVTEEEREERRRIWWLVYTVDRHLSLCYNKPLFLLDVECEGLLQPMDDTLWQAGEFYSGDSSIHITSPNGSARIRRRGPNFECTGHSIFGYFLPLMTILGEIVDLNHAKNHPRFGIGFRSSQEWDDYATEITLQLEAYERSLKEFEQRHLSTSSHTDENGNIEMTNNHNDITSPSGHSVNTNTSRLTTELDIQTRIVVAYGTHVMHVLHILLTGKWDPISLLDDNDLWISTQSFINATGHAVSAAEAIENILEFDPGLEFMPFFFGVYLLQGSFLLLLIADKLQSEASPSVVKACETIVRAHEACVATLNTEYQVSHPLVFGD
jgi:xylanolytic transcriptional activator XlnR